MTYRGEGVNEYGTPISLFTCAACGEDFTVCPAVPEEKRDEWEGCMDTLCPSYDIDRDVDHLFAIGGEIEREQGEIT